MRLMVKRWGMGILIGWLLLGVAGCGPSCIKGNCDNGYGVEKFRGWRYEGAFRDGKFHGEGVLRGPGGETSDGEFFEGEFIGR